MSRFSLQHTFCMSNLSSQSGTVLNKINEESMLPCKESKTRIYHITCWLVYKTQREKGKKKSDVQPHGMEYSQELSLLKPWQITLSKEFSSRTTSVLLQSELWICFLPSLYSQKPWMNIERKWRPHEKTLMTLNAIMNISAHHLRCKHTAGFLNVCQYTKISNRKSFSMEWKNLMQKLNLFLLHFLTTALGLISSYLFWYKHHCLQKKKKKKELWNIHI